MDDIQNRMEGWGKEGRMDPFKDVYDVSIPDLFLNYQLSATQARLPNDCSHGELPRARGGCPRRGQTSTRLLDVGKECDTDRPFAPLVP